MNTCPRTPRPGVCLLLAFLALVRTAGAAEDFFDSIDDHLKFSAYHDYLTARLSGHLDLEEYYIQQPPPGLIYAEHNFVFNPSLTLNLDVQIGPQLYLFGEAALEHGYDPTDEGVQINAVQYA